MIILFLIWSKCCTYIIFIVIIVQLFLESMELNLLFEDEPIMPSMLVDKDLLPNQWLYTQENSAYEINGEIFFLKEDNSDEYFRFEVVSDSESLVEDEDSNAVLPISIQKTPYGLIINSVILLNSDHWNTIIRQDEYLWCCVCFNIIEESSSHVENGDHIQNMEKYPPLERFDLNIVRSINDRFHCGVCNELFEIDSENDHLNSKDHENKQLTALNRSSDVLYDFDIHSERVLKESYHFDLGNEVSSDDKNTDNVESMSVDTDVTGSYMDLNDNDVFYDVEFEYKQPISGVSYASMAANMPKEFLIDWLGTKYKIKSDSWNMVIGVKLEYYCMACKKNGEIAQKNDHCKDKTHIERLQQCQPVTEYPDYIIRKVDDKFYHCGNCNNLQLAHLISDHIERVHNQKLKSIPNKTDEVLKKVKKKLSKLPKTTSSIQNNVKIDEIKDTPDTSDRGIVGNTGSNDDVNTGSSSNENNVTKNINNVTPKITLPDNGNLGNANQVHIKTVPFELHKNIIIHQFGFNIRVSLLAYNLVWIQYNHYYCGLCNVLLDPAYVMPHLETARHMQMLAQISFIPVLGVNLMRTVYLRNSQNLHPEVLVSVHCTICNHPMVNDKWSVNAHILDNVHLARLNMALDIGNQPPPLPQMVQYKHNNKIISNPVANIGESSQINIEKNLRSETNSADLNQEKVDNRTKVGLHEEESDKQTNVGLYQEKVDSQSKVGLHQEKVDSQTKVDLHQEKVDSQTKVGLHQEKVDSQTKVDLHQEKVDSQTKVYLHQEKVDSQTKVDLHQEKVDSQTKENVNNPSKVCLYSDKMVNQTKVGLQKEKVDNQTKVDSHQEKVENPTKIGLHQAKIDNQTKVCLLQEKVDNQTDLNQDIVPNQKKVLTQNNNEIIFNLEELIFVKLKNNCIKITLGSLNALVHIGNGGRYCFLCSLTVLALNEHLESELHLKNMNECKFIDKYEKHLIRQNSEMYHCSICNIMISKKDIQKHLSWSLHIKSDSLRNAKRQPDSSDTKTFKSSLAKEVPVNLKEELKSPIILANFTFESGNTVESVAKKNKIIILNGKAFKLTWDAWQGVCKSKNGYHCNLCKCDLKNYELNSHVCLGKHMRSLESFEIKYLPALIRKVDNATLNCVTCNSEISNKYHIIIDHIKGKKHLKHYDDIRQASSNTDIGCNDDVFTIE